MVAIQWTRTGASVLAVLFWVVAINFGAIGQEAGKEKARWPRVHVPDPIGAYVMGEVLDRVSALLAEPECGRVLTDFSDQQGRPLADHFAALDVDVHSYLTRIVFIDGTRDRQCGSGAVAFTVPGSRVVRLCVDELKRAWQRNRTDAVAAIIHEVLHTLGLGENPPSPRQITAQVVARCLI